METGRQWVARLGGHGLLPKSYAVAPAFAVGYFRFDPLIEEIEAPSLPFHYISVTLGGPLRIEANVGDKRVNVRVRKGQSMIMAAGRNNSWRWDGPTDDAFIFLRPEYLRTIAEETGISNHDILDRFVFEDAGLRRTILAIIDELSASGTPSRLFLDMAAQSLAQRLLRRHCGNAPSCDAAVLTATQLRRIIDLVHERLDADIDLETLAEAAGVSRFHFVRGFKATTGQSPHKWLTAQRMEHAKTLLRQTRLGMIDIASAVGFDSQSHFGQVFRTYTGSTPRAWRGSSSVS